MAAFTAVQPILDTFLFFVPLYYEAKLAFAIYLWAYNLNGASNVYHNYLEPFVSRHEPLLDRKLEETKAVATDFLHSNMMRAVQVVQSRAIGFLLQVQQQATSAGQGGGEDVGAMKRGLRAEQTGQAAQAASPAKSPSRSGLRSFSIGATGNKKE
jgi:receptor expression-enhancing protein 1/2/3/4